MKKSLKTKILNWRTKLNEKEYNLTYLTFLSCFVGNILDLNKNKTKETSKDDDEC